MEPKSDIFPGTPDLLRPPELERKSLRRKNVLYACSRLQPPDRITNH